MSSNLTTLSCKPYRIAILSQSRPNNSIPVDSCLKYEQETLGSTSGIFIIKKLHSSLILCPKNAFETVFQQGHQNLRQSDKMNHAYYMH